MHYSDKREKGVFEERNVTFKAEPDPVLCTLYLNKIRLNQWNLFNNSFRPLICITTHLFALTLSLVVWRFGEGNVAL